MSDSVIRCVGCGRELPESAVFCNYCGARNGAWEAAEDKIRCGRCNAVLEPGEKYCRTCGTKVGEGTYDPRRDLMQCVYGPMPKMKQNKCKSCGFEWRTASMLKEKTCPRCGKPISGIRGLLRRLTGRVKQ